MVAMVYLFLPLSVISYYENNTFHWIIRIATCK